ncbi:MAG TPA: 3-deoxy-7-phosphoheptulonate synthase [Gammaproteobacteria bacterium]|nr:3-deoxy-7-phosphoheptulonate synthase [Gammaproteobacteria bacterium]
MIHVLNPQNEPGRLTLITRFGAKHIEEHLPRVIRAVRATGSRVLWVCDRCTATRSRRPRATRLGASTTFSPSSSTRS